MAYADLQPQGVAMKETAFTRLSAAVERLEKATAGVSDLASRLVGEAPPETAGANASGISGSGMFDRINEQATRIDDLVATIAGHVQRVAQRM